jgi:cell division cycle protein 20 (cofactor of APC complex)
LDAPDLVDDYYLNLLSWSQNNVLAVALGQAVYLWNAETGAIDELMQCSDPDDYVTSLSWVADGGQHLAVGTNHADVQLWDATTLKQVRSMPGHEARVSAMAWNSHILSSGSRDSSIINHDVRVRQHHVSTFAEHQQEVCGLAWSTDGSTLASGGNDNLLCLWDSSTSGRNGARFMLKQHQAAVKALAWSPHERNVLASGGGTADRTIKFWNTQNGAMLNSIDTGSQVCSLLWSQTDKEILSSHGFSQNQLCLWKYPNMMKVKELKGHTARVLHMAASPNGSTVVSAAADETLRFWDIFAAPSKLDKKGSLDSNSKFMSSMRIR